MKLHVLQIETEISEKDYGFEEKCFTVNSMLSSKFTGNILSVLELEFIYLLSLNE